MNQRCYQGQHLTLTMALAVPGLVLVALGIPVWSAWFLGRNEHLLFEREFLACWSFLYADCGCPQRL